MIVTVNYNAMQLQRYSIIVQLQIYYCFKSITVTAVLMASAITVFLQYYQITVIVCRVLL